MTSMKTLTNSIRRVTARPKESACRPQASRGRPSGDTSPSSGGPGQQLRQPDQIESGAREHEEPVDLRQSPQFDFPDPRDRFQPAERRFDAGPRMLTLPVA